ncbi:hypothetical protein EVAR_29472_1 [Eumeta japonica]|uniref:Uncharacterized protein n=1 Tax=Eumeta variegata TaxID=151549 RepID=A0A4C1WSD0_EUMVA|nr:hypothetical protein EVAR_29472_1 [Eumeta japonica]
MRIRGERTASRVSGASRAGCHCMLRASVRSQRYQRGCLLISENAFEMKASRLRLLSFLVSFHDASRDANRYTTAIAEENTANVEQPVEIDRSIIYWASY